MKLYLGDFDSFYEKEKENLKNESYFKQIENKNFYYLIGEESEYEHKKYFLIIEGENIYRLISDFEHFYNLVDMNDLMNSIFEFCHEQKLKGKIEIEFINQYKQFEDMGFKFERMSEVLNWELVYDMEYDEELDEENEIPGTERYEWVKHPTYIYSIDIK